MRAFDTTAAAAAVHEDAQRQAGPIARFNAALELSDLTHALAVAGLRRRRPELTDEEARRELARLLYGRSETR